MTTRWLLAALHLMALGIGFAAIWGRARALRHVSSDREAIGRILAADSVWGLSAIVWISTGLLRAFGGLEKGSAYYLGSSAFWLKMGLLLLILLLELRPMTVLVRWRVARARQREVDVSAAPTLALVSYAQAAILLGMVLVATAMARGIGGPG